MLNENFNSIKKHILEELTSGLPSYLTYHTVYHVKDVLLQAERIAFEEKITGDEELFLLKVAALYHDSGFLFTYNGHEEKSCEIAGHDLPEFGVTAGQLQTIRGLIMATKVPQNPNNHLEQILCDADLDYLGRDDFYPISQTLFQELLSCHAVKNENEWDQIQVKFLEAHHYFTETSIRLRQSKKIEHLSEIRARVKKFAR